MATILPLKLSSSTVGVPSLDVIPSGITNIDDPTDKLTVVVTAIPRFTSNWSSDLSLVTVKDPKNGAAVTSNVDPVSPSVLTPTVDIATVTLLLTDNP